ncbi:MAG: phenylalanine--tRNA ligase subunit alpha [Peptoniphilaceae bacterium]|nr:phenylalanine--tRNA ligase subunit alpha [Peptoniphilaceae bacterium]MDD7383281.1 phenylalanine--tRNA ligase subunit alpha [Peptoniphilaceae bacterium]MDY3738348.1 phenylalanine--tRNA ligase subunit alpha [Peptoniphilaceae bacterium]
MQQLASDVVKKAEDKIKNADELKTLNDIRVEFTGKKGEFTKLMKNMSLLDKQDKPEMGKILNSSRQKIEQLLSAKIEEIKNNKIKKQIIEETIDVTANKNKHKIGHLNLINETMAELENLFRTMGFDIVEGPEIDTVKNSFDDLNSPKNHPARDLTDTFYINEEIVLRPHTSPVQIRTMKKGILPIRMVSAGRTFRNDEVDNTHSPMFHQMEGLVVDEGVSMANLKETIDLFIKKIFGDEMKTRYRPHHFPFTEPSLEVDVTCPVCKGKGCESCNNTGWSMELLGGGMVHPKVLENCGIDSEKYTGFAFGMGVDRIAMVKHGIDDIRLLYDNDMRFLEQF